MSPTIPDSASDSETGRSGSTTQVNSEGISPTKSEHFQGLPQKDLTASQSNPRAVKSRKVDSICKISLHKPSEENFLVRVAKLDTGASVNVMSQVVFSDLDMKMDTYNGPPLKPLGKSVINPLGQVEVEWHELNSSVEIVIYSGSEEWEAPVRAKLDKTLPISVISKATLDRLPPDYTGTQRDTVEDSDKNQYSPICQIELRWHYQGRGRSHPETFYVVEGAAWEVILGAKASAENTDAFDSGIRILGLHQQTTTEKERQENKRQEVQAQRAEEKKEQEKKEQEAREAMQHAQGPKKTG
ncbi:hypothetical protein MMC07_001599 [Pseudocyphellaria aurata]|nr:hypothetical protein [Pseudocyphellaria aurata]